jgi:hypothetical protein
MLPLSPLKFFSPLKTSWLLNFYCNYVAFKTLVTYKTTMKLKFVHLQKVCFLGFLIFLSSYPCFAETLISFKDGGQTRAEDLLAQGKALVYIERGCSACHQYVQNIVGCKEAVQERIQIVSINTPAQTKEMSRKLPIGLPLYMVIDRGGAASVNATPTTRLARNQKVGILKCDELEVLMSKNQI